jgi:hypothetical protein
MRNFDDHKKMMFLQRRVYELERENKELRGKNRELVQHLSNYSHGITAPLIPTSPIPPPPPNLQILPSPTNSSLDLISLNEIFTIAQNGESTSNNRDDLFDNNFDPRASSSTSSQKHPAEPNNQDNNSSVQNPKDSLDVDFLSKRMEVFEEQYHILSKMLPFLCIFNLQVGCFPRRFGPW